MTADEKLQRYRDLQIELDKRKHLIQSLAHDYPQIAPQTSASIEQLNAHAERLRDNLLRKQEVGTLVVHSPVIVVFRRKECDLYSREQKQYRDRIQGLLNWLDQSHRYEPLGDRRDLDSLEREQTRLIDTRAQIDDQLREIDALLRSISR